MKLTVLAFAVSATIAGLAQPAFAQDAGLTPAPVPADTTQRQVPATDKAKLQQPVLMSKPVPKRPVSEGTMVIGGLFGGLAVIAAVAGAGGGGSDHPSSP